MSKAKKSVAEAVTEIAFPIAKELGLELWDVKFLKEGSNFYLRVFIDKPEGITLEDCENMSRKLDEPLDILDPIDVSYCLEVCSPGIERELSSDAHFEKYIGSEVNAQLIRPDENKNKNICGKLHSFDKETVKIETEEQIFELPRKNIAKINLKMLEERN